MSRFKTALFNYSISIIQEQDPEDDQTERVHPLLQTLVQYVALKEKPIQYLFEYFLKRDLVNAINLYIRSYNRKHPDNQVFSEITGSSNSLNIEIIVKKGIHRRTLVALLHLNQHLELEQFFYGNLGCILPSARQIVTSLSHLWKLVEVQLGGFIEEEQLQR